MFELISSLPFVMAIAFMLFITTIAYIIDFLKKSKLNSNNMTLGNISRDPEKATNLLKAHIAAIHNTKANVHKYREEVLENLFLKKLQQCFPDLNYVEQSCTIPEEPGDKPLCTNIIGIQNNSILVYLSPYIYSAYLHDDRPRCKLVNNSEDTIEDYVLDGSINVSYGAHIAVSTDIYNQETLDKISQLLRECTIESIDYPEKESPSSLKYYGLTKMHDSYVLQEMRRDITPMTRKQLSLSYGKVPITYEGKDYQVPMGDAMQLIVESALQKENVCFFGQARTGKSYLADEIALRCAKQGLGVIFITPAIMQEFQTTQMMSDLQRAVKQLKDWGMSPLIVIDEAEHLLKKPEDGIHSITNSFMLSMMDGIFQKTLNCSFILTFNADKDKLNEKAFMTGRMGLELNLGALEVQQATELKNFLLEMNPMMVFDTAKWETMSKQNNLLLADVYSCFAPPSKTRTIERMLKAMQAPPDESVEVQSTGNSTKLKLSIPPAVTSNKEEKLPEQQNSLSHNHRHEGKKRWKNKHRQPR